MAAIKGIINLGKAKLRELAEKADDEDSKGKQHMEKTGGVDGDGEESVCELVARGISKCSQWNEDCAGLLPDLEMADIVEFRRKGGVYTHVGIYDGQGHIIDYSSDRDRPFGTAIVQKRPLQEVAHGDPVRICNWDGAAGRRVGFHAYSPQEVVARCESQLGKSFPYNVLTENCQVFATRMKYGCGFTFEVEDVTTNLDQKVRSGKKNISKVVSKVTEMGKK